MNKQKEASNVDAIESKQVELQTEDTLVPVKKIQLQLQTEDILIPVKKVKKKSKKGPAKLLIKNGSEQHSASMREIEQRISLLKVSTAALIESRNVLKV